MPLEVEDLGFKIADVLLSVHVFEFELLFLLFYLFSLFDFVRNLIFQLFNDLIFLRRFWRAGDRLGFGLIDLVIDHRVVEVLHEVHGVFQELDLRFKILAPLG